MQPSNDGEIVHWNVQKLNPNKNKAVEKIAVVSQS